MAVSVQRLSGGAYVPYGTAGSPLLITAVGGIAVGSDTRQIRFIAGNGGPVEVTANPAIGTGNLGQELILQGRSASNTVLLDNGPGVVLNGAWLARLGSQISFIHNGTSWVEVARNDL